MKDVKTIKKEIIGKIMSQSDLENYMIDAGYALFDGDTPAGTVAVYTDGKRLFYIKGVSDDDEANISDVTISARMNSEPTKVDPFHSYEDLEAVFKYFEEKGAWGHWLACRLMVGLGRRCGDTLNLRWCDLYKNRECTKFFDKCMRLKEEKTGKIIAPHITEYVQMSIEEYRSRTKFDPTSCYGEKIFSCGTPALRAAVKKAVDYVGIEYPVSLHSFRKTYGNWTYKIHKNEGVCLEIIRGMFGHNDTAITRLYIDQTNEDAKRYANDLSDYLIGKENGNAVEINNSPNVTVKAELLRSVLSQVFDAGMTGGDKFEAINAAIGLVEKEGI